MVSSSVARSSDTGSSLVRWSRLGAIATAWVFAACVVAQVFLAGASLFESATHWAEHRSVGEYSGTFTILLVIFAVVGRLSVPVIAMAVAIFFGYGFQWIFAGLDNGWVASLHAVNALILFWLSVEVAKRATVAYRMSNGNRS